MTNTDKPRNPIRLCKTCGGEFHKIRTVSWKRFNKRKYCSQKCYREWMNEHREGWWKSSDNFKDSLSLEDKKVLSILKEFNY